MNLIMMIVVLITARKFSANCRWDIVNPIKLSNFDPFLMSQ